MGAEKNRKEKLEYAKAHALNVGADWDRIAEDADLDVATADGWRMIALGSMLNATVRKDTQMRAITDMMFALYRQLELIRQQGEETNRLLREIAGNGSLATQRSRLVSVLSAASKARDIDDAPKEDVEQEDVTRDDAATEGADSTPEGATVLVALTWWGSKLRARMKFEDTGETRDYPATFENVDGMDRHEFAKNVAEQIEWVIKRPVRWYLTN